MEDVAGARVRDAMRDWFGFVTWDRLWDPMDETELLEALRTHLSGSSITGTRDGSAKQVARLRWGTAIPRRRH